MRAWLTIKREEKNMTKAEMARKIGVSWVYYHLIEKGEKTPSGFVGKRISDELGFELEKFYSDDFQPKK